MNRFFRILFATALLLIFGATSGAETDMQKIPAFSANVVDQAGWMTSQEVLALNKKITNIEKEGKIRIGVLVVSTVKPETIEQYSMRVAETWKIGQKKVDNGLLFVIAKEDRKARLEVGYGLEGSIPDVTAKRIMADAVGPKLTSGHLYDGLVIGIDSVMKHTSEEAVHEKTVSTEDGVNIPFLSEMPTGAQVLVGILGIIGGILLIIGGYGESGGAILCGLIIPVIGGFVLGVIFYFSICITIAIAALVLAIVFALGIGVGGGVVVGGLFGGGGASADF